MLKINQEALKTNDKIQNLTKIESGYDDAEYSKLSVRFGDFVHDPDYIDENQSHEEAARVLLESAQASIKVDTSFTHAKPLEDALEQNPELSLPIAYMAALQKHRIETAIQSRINENTNDMSLSPDDDSQLVAADKILEKCLRSGYMPATTPENDGHESLEHALEEQIKRVHEEYGQEIHKNFKATEFNEHDDNPVFTLEALGNLCVQQRALSKGEAADITGKVQPGNTEKSGVTPSQQQTGLT